jgi:hypothetical protein
MQRLRTRFLMRAYGVTEAQAQALCTLIWGAC